MRNKILIVVALLWSSIVFSCPARLMPEGANNYETVFLGEVVGVTLQEYKKLRWEAIKKGDIGMRRFSDYTLNYLAHILPIEVFKGELKRETILQISGCGILEPEVREFGIFFVKKNGDVNVIYARETGNYEKYLLRLGSQYR